MTAKAVTRLCHSATVGTLQLFSLLISAAYILYLITHSRKSHKAVLIYIFFFCHTKKQVQLYVVLTIKFSGFFDEKKVQKSRILKRNLL